MRKRSRYASFKKRAVIAGLFLGMLCGMTGCVKPVTQTGGPQETATPVPVPTGEVPPLPSSTPLPTAPPEATRPVQPTAIPTPELSPTKPLPPVTGSVPSPTPVAEGTPTPTPESLPTATPTPDAEITGETTPELLPSPTPELIPSPTPEATPEVLPTATPGPEPTPYPDYGALLQNGWQRTEDFFGCREIYFSGRFTDTELFATEGRYEYRYTIGAEPGVSFSVIGEEDAGIQQFLDELIQKDTSCELREEGEADFSYSYSEENMRIRGRVYACEADAKEHRMRVEMRYPVGEENQTEGYDFYLK